jgi:hypothetical protein
MRDDLAVSFDGTHYTLQLYRKDKLHDSKCPAIISIDASSGEIEEAEFYFDGLSVPPYPTNEDEAIYFVEETCRRHGHYPAKLSKYASKFLSSSMVKELVSRSVMAVAA